MVKRNGRGATCSALVRFMHPKAKIKERLPNAAAQDRITDLVVLRAEDRKIKNEDKPCIIFIHDDWPGEELYCHNHFCSVALKRK